MSQFPRTSVSILVALCSLGAAGCAIPGLTPSDDEAVKAAANTLRAALSGNAEVPGPGDRDASGAALLALSLAEESLCIDLRLENLGSVRAAHLHWASIGIRGPVVLDLNLHTVVPVPCDGDDSCELPLQEFSRCLGVAPELLEAIDEAPEQYYVSVHTTRFPDGAARGQLRADDPGAAR